MYEEKSKKSLKIDWKSLVLKLAILLVVIFLIIWVISLFNKKSEKTVDIETNLQLMKNSAVDYFKGSHLPNNINSKEKLTLKEMIDKKAIINFDEDSLCSKTESYIEATKINSNDYTVKAKLVCGDNSDAVITTITEKSSQNDYVVPGVNTDNVNNNTIDNNQDSTNNTTTTKPNTNTNNSSTTKPSATTKPSTSKPNNTTVSKPSTTPTVKPNATNKTCKYGDANYNSSLVVSYKIASDCAVSIDDYYTAKYANPASEFGTKEYQKLIQEVSDLKRQTNTNLVVSQPVFSAVYNKTSTGLVGYNILYSVKENLNYSERVVYQYYLNSNGSRSVLIDNRGSLGSNNNTTINKPNSNTNNIRVNSISLNRSKINLEKGESYNLIATIYPTNATNKTISWSSSNRSVATVSNGRVVAKGVGTATITATVDGKRVTCTVYVSDYNYNVNVTSVYLNTNSISLKPNDTYNLTATVYPTNATNKYVSWSSDNTRVARVSSTGKVTAVSNGYATITATVNGKKANCTVYVSSYNDIEATYMDLNVGFLNLKIGESFTVKATVLPENVTNKKVTWTSSNTRVAKVSSTGKVTAVGSGYATITATSPNGYQSLSIPVTVSNEYNSGATNLIVNTDNVNLDYGKSYTLNTQVYPYGEKVKFSSGNLKVASVSSSGTINAVGSGTTVITVSVGNLKEYVTVRVTKPIKGITLNTNYVELYKGGSYLFDTEITNLSCTPTYNSSNRNVATIDNYGRVRLVTDIVNSSSLITVHCGNYEASAFVIGNPDYSYVSNIKFNNMSYSLNVGETYKLTAIATPAITTDYAFKWTSENPRIAEVDKNGKVTGLRPGSTTIYASLGNQKASIKINVY